MVDYKNIQDEELIREVQGGNGLAFNEMYSRYARKVRLAVFQYTHPDDLEDVVQGVFLLVYEKIGQYKGQAKFHTWLYRVAVNHALNQHRKKQVREADNWVSTDTVYDTSKGCWVSGVDVGAEDPRLENAGDLEKMYHFIEKLPESMKLTVQERLMGEPFDVIAKKYQRNESTVRSDYSRAVQLLHKWMIGEDDEPGNNGE